MAKKKTKSTPKRYVPRQTRKFQLRHNHPIDSHVTEILDYSRSQRREVTVIRDGVRLLWALENNDMGVLFELFPHLKTQFTPGTAEALEQFMQILKQQQPVNSGAGQLTKYEPAIPLPAPPKAEIKQSTAVSADTIADNFLSMFQ